ncbi:MAG: hypothetical protein WB677_16860 [Xanthobacteraceae bacterium]
MSSTDAYGRLMLLAYAVAVMLLAWWPWNVLLLIPVVHSGKSASPTPTCRPDPFPRRHRGG